MRYWIGWTLSGLAILFLVMDAVMKLLALPIVIKSGEALGFPGADMARTLGIILSLHGPLCFSPYVGTGGDPAHGVPRRIRCNTRARRQPPVHACAVRCLRGDSSVGRDLSARLCVASVVADSQELMGEIT